MLPQWNLNNIYQNIKDTEKDIIFLQNSISNLLDYTKDILISQNSQKEDVLKNIIKQYEQIIEINRKLQAYVICILSTDSKNEDAQKVKGILHNINSSLMILTLQIEKALSQVKPHIPEYKYFIERCIENSEHRMLDEEEKFYSEIFISSSAEWKSLYSDLISNIKVEFENEIISISKLRSFYNHPDRNLRKKAYEKELEVFKEYEYIFSKILNSVKWDSIIISRKRKFNNVLEKSLFDNHIDREILEIVLNTSFENLNVVRKYFYKKAELMGLEKLEWFDISAPLFENYNEIFYFDKAKTFILENFRNFSREMYNMALLAFEKSWIDTEPRLGKTDGGFCIYVFSNESRILVNYDNSIKSLLTLAHELGHAYHNYVMSENTPLYRHSPLILAETASILAETITRKNALKTINNIYTKIQILDGYLYTVSVVVIDILSRFIFEDKIINIRKERILTPSELCDIMIDSQQEVYLDSINSFHPYMWANKPHYYSANYYNYPYLIGLLIGLSLYNLYENGKIDSRDYRNILKNSAKDKPEKVLKAIGLNIREKDFWQQAFELLKKDIDEFINIEPPVR